MRQQITRDQCAGKVVESIGIYGLDYSGDQDLLVVCFKDNTFIAFEDPNGYSIGEITEFSQESLTNGFAVESTIITEEERLNLLEEQYKALRRKKYLELRAEFQAEFGD